MTNPSAEDFYTEIAGEEQILVDAAAAGSRTGGEAKVINGLERQR
jgi:hypothetical protein